MFPKLVTGEVRRNYNFRWFITPTSSKLLALFSSTYISGLASKIDLPTQEIITNSVKIGPVEYPVPAGIKLSPIVVDYIEDDLGNVERMHRVWQGTARAGIHSMTISALSRFSGVAMYVPTTTHFLSDETLATIANSVSALKFNSLNWANTSKLALTTGIDEVPTGLQIWPKVFPQSITPTQVTKEGQAYAGVRVTYIRIPTINGWKPLQKIDNPADSSLGKNAKTSTLPDEPGRHYADVQYNNDGQWHRVYLD